MSGRKTGWSIKYKEGKSSEEIKESARKRERKQNKTSDFGIYHECEIDCAKRSHNFYSTCYYSLK